MKLKIDTDYMWDELSNKQRKELIIELIMTAPDSQSFKDEVINAIQKLEID